MLTQEQEQAARETQQRIEVKDAKALAEQLAKLSAMAERVSAQAAAYDEAITAENNAEAVLLEAVVERVRPALRALSSRIQSRNDSTSGANGLNPVEEIDYHQERGVKLAGGYYEDRDETGNCGTYEGSALYLLTDGTFAENVYSGTWSRWQGAWNRLAGELEPLSLVEVVKRYKVDELLEVLAKRLGEQLAGSAPAKMRAALERASKVAAIAKLAGK